MSFDENIAALIQRIPKIVDHLQTEEATKNALVMPFIAALFSIRDAQARILFLNSPCGSDITRLAIIYFTPVNVNKPLYLYIWPNLVISSACQNFFKISVISLCKSVIGVIQNAHLF